MINKIELRNFRNHENFLININNNFVYITGPNGSGKTSILESIYLISNTKSHRTRKDQELIKKNEFFSHVKITTKFDKYELVLSDKGKLAKINNKEVLKLSDFIGKLQVVMFSPEDMDLIKGSPSIRRSFIDIELMKLNQIYLNNLTKYRNILKQRNALLKNININDDFFFLDTLGNQLFEVGKKIMKERNVFLHDLNNELIKVYKNFSDEELKITYKPNLSKENYYKHLKNNQKQDIIYKTTTAGPHRDDFTIDYRGFEAKSYASQGQTRLIAVALKLALLNLIRKKTNKEVILLLDDVLSELDKGTQKRFLNNLPKDLQIIMNSAIKIEKQDMQIIELKESRK